MPLYREWGAVKRSDTFTIVPLGDVHIGNRACDETLFASVVKRIKDDPTAYWIGMGDYADFVNRSDKRFSVTSLADWLKVEHLGDLAKAQRDRYLDHVLPIADKCLGLVGGNHERAIKRYYERDIHAEIVTAIKQAAGHPPEFRLGLDYCGWLQLFFRVDDKHTRGRTDIYLHHGFVGGKLAGAKALNMQRWLWSHDADLVLFGHSHNTGVQVEAVEEITRYGTVRYQHRIGAYAGTFMRGAEYAQEKGYFPLPLARVEIQLRPGAKARSERLRVVTIG
jgi:predicted phosphodiesterase